MKIGSVLENQNLEKRIAITPELVKKYTSIGFEVNLIENYGSHLGIKDKQYQDLGVRILKDEVEVLNSFAELNDQGSFKLVLFYKLINSFIATIRIYHKTKSLEYVTVAKISIIVIYIITC